MLDIIQNYNRNLDNITDYVPIHNARTYKHTTLTYSNQIAPHNMTNVFRCCLFTIVVTIFYNRFTM
jgi:hypothetical protein